jgi:hypothetical protein
MATRIPILNGAVSPRNAGLLLGFAAAGVLLTAVAFSLGASFERIGTTGAALLLLALPVVLVAGLVGFRQGLHHLVVLRRGWTWWHGLLTLLFISTMVFRIRDSQQSAAQPVDVWALFRLGPEIVIAIILLVRALRHHIPWVRTLFGGLLRFVAVYGLVCLTSAIWSVYWSWTLYKSLEFLLDFSVLAAILTTVDSAENFQSAMNYVWFLFGLDLAWAWVGSVLWPSEAFDELGRLSGVWPVVAANSIGVAGAVLCLVAFARVLRADAEKSARPWYLLVFLFGTVCLIASQTRNAMAGLVLSALVMLWYLRRTLVGIAGGVSLFFGVIAMGWSGRILEFLSREQTQSQMEGLSSRVNWWAFAIRQWSRAPLTGLGAYAAGKFAVLGQLHIGEVSHLHSDWVETFVGTSVWGLIPLILAVAGCWWVLVRTRSSSVLSLAEKGLALEAIGVLASITLRSFFNDELIWHTPFLFMIVIGSAEFLRRRMRQPSPVPVRAQS